MICRTSSLPVHISFISQSLCNVLSGFTAFCLLRKSNFYRLYGPAGYRAFKSSLSPYPDSWLASWNPLRLYNVSVSFCPQTQSCSSCLAWIPFCKLSLPVNVAVCIFHHVCSVFTDSCKQFDFIKHGRCSKYLLKCIQLSPFLL